LLRAAFGGEFCRPGVPGFAEANLQFLSLEFIDAGEFLLAAVLLGSDVDRLGLLVRIEFDRRFFVLGAVIGGEDIAVNDDLVFLDFIRRDLLAAMLDLDDGPFPLNQFVVVLCIRRRRSHHDKSDQQGTVHEDLQGRQGFHSRVMNSSRFKSVRARATYAAAS